MVTWSTKNSLARDMLMRWSIRDVLHEARRYSSSSLLSTILIINVSITTPRMEISIQQLNAPAGQKPLRYIHYSAAKILADSLPEPVESGAARYAAVQKFAYAADAQSQYLPHDDKEKLS
jgi:hypothetical protein